MSAHDLAQLNIARARDELDSPVVADFVANLDRINALGEATAGFICASTMNPATPLPYAPATNTGSTPT